MHASQSSRHGPESDVVAPSAPVPLPVLSLVVPCYNEAEALTRTAEVLGNLLKRMVDEQLIAPSSRVWYVDDGSRDETWSLIQKFSADSRCRARGIKLSRNRGHQVALLCGLMTATGDALLSIDADLQDDVEAIPAMVAAFVKGADIVYGVRNDRTTDSWFKRSSAEGYYRLLRWAGAEVVFNHADFRLMSRRAIEALRGHGERNVYLRGIIPQLGFRSATVEYTRSERTAGESKYPLGKMLGLAWQGITSFSVAPLRAITLMGFGIFIVSLVAALWAIATRLFTTNAIPGWASTVIPMFILAGLQFLALGVIGEYLAKVFVESKRRPLYFVEQVTPDDAVGQQPTIRNGGAQSAPKAMASGSSRAPVEQARQMVEAFGEGS